MWSTTCHILRGASAVCGAVVPCSQGHSKQNGHRVETQELPTHPWETSHVPRNATWRMATEFPHSPLCFVMHDTLEMATYACHEAVAHSTGKGSCEVLYIGYGGVHLGNCCIYVMNMNGLCIYDMNLKGLIRGDSECMI